MLVNKAMIYMSLVFTLFIWFEFCLSKKNKVQKKFLSFLSSFSFFFFWYCLYCVGLYVYAYTHITQNKTYGVLNQASIKANWYTLLQVTLKDFLNSMLKWRDNLAPNIQRSSFQVHTYIPLHTLDHSTNTKFLWGERQWPEFKF